MIDDISARLAARAPDIEYVEPQPGLIARLHLFIQQRRANALLRRTLRPRRAGNAAQLSPHLLKDIGLPPDMRL